MQVMKAKELAKVYNPKDFEERIYALWMEKKSFSPDNSRGGDPFVIVIPPPNVTGALHMGHGLNNSLQDILIRYYRMKGRRTLWLPGTDHAGIATQNVVEKKLRAKGLTRRQLGRAAFIRETWKLKEEHHAFITNQLKKIGASCDWDRERFTLDEGLSRAVREVFVALYEKGLIYKGEYLVNWCSSCGTAISDDEVEHQELPGRMYYIQYPLEDGSGYLEIATTRPETLLGDVAVAVHPEDERYHSLVGKKVRLPLAERLIPVISDEYVDREFGTGVVKITPAHDPNDLEVGNRHNLARINILTPQGTLNENVPEKYRGMTVQEARDVVAADLEVQGYLLKEQEHSHQVGHCYRCGTVIEPFLSKQWFVKMRPLAEKALSAWQKGELRFFPKRWENTYAHWLNNIRDWCISRQLWWGHRIPVWYCDDCGEMVVSRMDPTACPKCGGTLTQDEDVLDTWFSSWLWPFSTLGWPDQTRDLATFFPTSTLVTGYDIIFFWVARMVMAGLEFMGTVPFQDVYITGLVRDRQGRKMSKSLGNGVDPLEVVEEYGADSLKFTLAFLAATGHDILANKESFKLGSKFANKIWNATRFVFMNLEDRRLLPWEQLTLKDMDRWILHRLNKATAEVTAAVESYRFNDAAKACYEFFWNDFCDWYIEGSKLSLYSQQDEEQDRAASLLVRVLEEALRLLHPFLSFLTEELYQHLPEREETLIRAPYPEVKAERDNPEIGARFTLLQELIRSVRTLRSEFAIPPSQKPRLWVKTDHGFAAQEFFRGNQDLIVLLTGAGELVISGEFPQDQGSIPAAGNGFEAYLFIRDLIDVPRELEKLNKERERSLGIIDRSTKKLNNANFIQRAPAEVVEKERRILAELTERVHKIEGYLEELGKES